MPRVPTRFAAVLALAGVLHDGVHGAAPDLSEKFFNDPGKVIVFFGDSITANGAYIGALKALILKRFPGLKASFVNRGKSSETLAGLTEGDHPGPRPVLFDRLATELATHKPHLVFACYGMNDGIYHPWDETRMAPFRAGVRRLLEEGAKAGIPVILVTPPPFDSLGGLSKIKSAPPYGYKTPYRNYDSVLTAYGQWERTLAGADQWVVEIHDHVEKAATAKRAVTPGFTLTGDGIHPGADGHRWMAEAIEKGLFEGPVAVEVERGRLRPLRAARDVGSVTFPWDAATADAMGRVGSGRLP
jgi:lysophospholipase L1-like esterase